MHVIFMPFDKGNPYQTALGSALRTTGVAIEGRPFRWFLLRRLSGIDAIHFHWTYGPAGATLWKFIVGYPLLAAQLILIRLTGRRIVWTVHNLENHEKKNPKRDRMISLLIGQLANTVIVHGKSAKGLVSKRFFIPSQKIVVIPHGNYIGSYPDVIKRDAARRKLYVDSSHHIFLFIGHIRPYKGVEKLIEVFKALKIGRANLLIAGRPLNTRMEERIRGLIGDDARILFFPGFVEKEEMQLYLNAADVVVYPFKEILTSGSVLLAMSFRKACIAPMLGCVNDVLDENGAFLYNPEDPDGLSGAMIAASQTSIEKLMNMGRYNRKTAEVFSWDKIAEKTSKAYR
jgi:beta-1,4-mannosyltransferase